MEELIRKEEFQQFDFVISTDRWNEIIEMRGNYDNTLLHLTAQHDQLEMTKRLIETGVDVNCTNKFGQTIAHVAALCGSEKCLKYVCQYFPHLLNKQDKAGQTSLYCAARNDQLRLVRLLIGHNVDVNIRNEDGLTPLDLTLYWNHLTKGIIGHDIVEELKKVSFVFSSLNKLINEFVFIFQRIT